MGVTIILQKLLTCKYLIFSKADNDFFSEHF